MDKKITWEKFIGEVTQNDKVLLINPPVYEIRYNWLKWNQPLDLLLLSSFLKNEVQCQVELFDFMLPRDTGRVSTRTDKSAVKENFQFVRYGRDLDEFKSILEGVISDWKPTKIIITSLTSYWYKGLIDVTMRIRNTRKIKDVQIFYVGNYPLYEGSHFATNFANYVITNDIDLSKCSGDFGLYYSDFALRVHENPPFFASIYPEMDNVVQHIERLYKLNIRDFAFFSDNLLRDKERFIDILKDLKKLRIENNVEAKIHGICGFYPSDFEPGLLKMMIEAGFTELHLEYDLLSDGTLNLPAYLDFRQEMQVNNIEFASGFLSGFVNFGCRDENLEQVIQHSLQILELLGTYIPKPFTASPCTDEYKRLSSQVSDLQLLSPHCYPFAKENGVSVEEYQNYLRLSAFLNTKVRGKSFDFFDDTEVTRAIQGAFKREVWNIGEESTTD